MTGAFLTSVLVILIIVTFDVILTIFFIIIIIEGEKAVRTIAGDVLLEGDAGLLELLSLFFGQLGLKESNLLLLIHFIFAHFSTDELIIIVEIAKELVSILSDTVKDFKAWEHRKDIFTLVLGSLAQGVAFEIQVLQVSDTFKSFKFSHGVDLVVA